MDEQALREEIKLLQQLDNKKKTSVPNESLFWDFSGKTGITITSSSKITFAGFFLMVSFKKIMQYPQPNFGAPKNI